MLFSSYSFLILFLPLLIIVYYIIPAKFRNYLLLIASLGFYAWGGPKYLLVMLLSIGINYVCGLLVDPSRFSPQAAKWAVVLAVILNLSLLGYYKYTDFFLSNINTVLKSDIPLPHIVLPIGISFYTFQGMSYVFDVKRGTGKVLKNPLSLALYISLFPQLIAGPIVRYETIAYQLNNRTTNIDDLEKGMYRFAIGLAKKVLLANMAGELAAKCFEMNPGSLDIVTAWVGAIAFSVQFFFNFCGYSDMAIGLGHIFGFSFPENFNYPYIADSITDFWRRWHISLSTWFRDYVYIPLGGNRKGQARQYLNLLIVWMLTGFWHGAAWNFIIWGLYYAVLLMIEKFLKATFKVKVSSVIKHIYTILGFIIGNIIFNASSVGYAWGYVKALFGGNGIQHTELSNLYYYVCEYGLILLLGCIAATPLIKNTALKICAKANPKAVFVLKLVTFLGILMLCIMRLVVSSFNPFIYFRF